LFLGITPLELHHLAYYFIEEYSFPEANIYSVDEMDVCTIQKPGHILQPKGQKQVGAAISWECGKNVTALCFVSHKF